MCIVNAYAHVYVHRHASVPKGQKRAPDPLALKLQAVTSCQKWMLGLKLKYEQQAFTAEQPL